MIATAIAGELCRYQVPSSRNPDEAYIVDLLETACGCKDWVCRHREYKQRTGRNYRCRHLAQVREQFLDEIIERLKEEQLSR